MSRQRLSPEKIEDYHAHIYYDAATRDVAAELREDIDYKFTVELGNWHDEAVGPHPQSMYRVKFAKTEFPRIVPWLMLNRSGLSILVHPNTNDAYEDHKTHALWLGDKLRLRLDVLREFIEKEKARRAKS
ncbi:MAG TPA: DOPA 4,5-dioxygenase family protein [Candidatus Binataceae bacterium]|nr:DOPA 4,5-dioxygenase family protein [Candidatus Binataceae bacterium]